jgi:hypothetical protein
MKIMIIFSIFFVGIFSSPHLKTYAQKGTQIDTLRISSEKKKKLTIRRDKISGQNFKKIEGSKMAEYHAYRFTIRNPRYRKLDFSFEQRIPISKNRVEVELLESSEADIDAQRGKLIWNLKLKGKEERIIEIKYIVRYPYTSKSIS